MGRDTNLDRRHTLGARSLFVGSIFPMKGIDERINEILHRE